MEHGFMQSIIKNQVDRLVVQFYMNLLQVCFALALTHLVWPHQPENPPGRLRARRISP